MINTTVDQRYTVQLFSGATLFLVIGSLILTPLQAIELVNGAHAPIADGFLSALTNMGDGFIIVPIFGILLFRRIYWAMGLVFNGFLQACLVSLCKRILFPHSLRPINFLDHDKIHIIPGVEIHKLMTFPSGHTVTAFGVFVFIALYMNNRGAAWLLMMAATFVALSRVYLLQHFLWDVAAGAVMGSAIGVFSFFLTHHTVKPRWMLQRLDFRAGSKQRRSWS